MEDSTAKTITFLRARLLAERSVSRTAKQRANELAKRVTELEKQLKFVSLQRKKAEKATVDVLAILENHGRNDLSEPFDSSSDQEEMSSDFKDGKHVETSKHVKKVPESDTEGFSGSEVESSSVDGRSLSWKSSKHSSSRFLEKYMDASRRRRNSFASTGSSPRRVGKSCRQIRHKEHRSAADVSQNDATNAHREDEGQTSSEGVENSADVATETSIEEHKICDEKDPPEEISTSLYNGRISQNNGTEHDMKQALEHQAQFIAQYEAEEKAQREWEDKFRENNGSTPDSCDPGTHSDVTEERDEVKAPPPAAAAPPYELTSGGQEIEVGEEPKVNTEPLLDQKNGDTNKVSDDPNVGPTQASSSRDCSLLCGPRGEQASGTPYEPTHENPVQLGSVLEALQQAKLSLKQNLDKFPLLESGPRVPSYRSEDKIPFLESSKYPVPFSPASLFRLPTDYEYGGATTRVDSLTYDSRLSLTTNPSSSGQFISRSAAASYRSEDKIPFLESSKYPVPFSPASLFRLPTEYEYGGATTRVDSLTYDSRLSLTTNPSSSGQFISQSAAASVDDRFRVVPTFPYQETRLETPTQSPSATFPPRSNVPPPPVLDPRFSAHPSAFDPRLSVQPSATNPRLDAGMGRAAYDPRLSLQPSATDPRLDVSMGRDPRLNAGMGRAAYDPRSDVGMGRDPRLDVGMGRTAYDPRSDAGMGRASYDPRLSLQPSASDPRLDVGMGRDPRLDAGMGRDPRLEIGAPFTGSRYGRTPSSVPGGDIPLRTRSLYDDYSRPNM